MLERVAAVPLPDWALLQRYAGHGGAYTDSFAVDVAGLVDLPAFARAFYGSWLFGLERAVLLVALRRAVPVEDAVNVARGEGTRFAAWTCQAHREDQMLLADNSGATRSWLAVEPRGLNTGLWFGSAVMAGRSGQLGRGMQAMIPAHKAYSRALLKAAQRRL